jgi:hypothetical protein
MSKVGAFLFSKLLLRHCTNELWIGVWHWENPNWDADKLLRTVELAVASGLRRYPKWPYPVLKPYRGYSGRARVAAWQRIRVALQMGLLPPPSRCSVCRNASNTGHYHCENYSKPLDAKPICPACHRALHRRFTAPECWLALVEHFATPGCWFGNLEMKNRSTNSRIKRRDVG